MGLGINLKSQFFNVTEFLHTRLTPKKAMGPALLEITQGTIGDLPNTKPARPSAQKGTGATIEARELNSEKVLGTVSVDQLRKGGQVKLGNFKLELRTYYKNAAVVQNKLVDSPEPGDNPAIEFLVHAGGTPYREVLFARFPDFSMAKETDKKARFIYKPGDGPAMDSSANLIRFTVDHAKPEKVQVELLKNGESVLRKVASEGETVATPWMGMQLTIGSIRPGAEPRDQVKAIEPPQRENLPTGALAIGPSSGGETIWIPEGETRSVRVGDREYSVYFGRKLVRLPFNIQLEKFYKKDYPGTETAMSYESDVRISGDSAVTKISMNEPLYKAGYTLYQSSYQIDPNGGPALSIFSINQDPGRRLKYFGSLILCLGIVIFTVMRSSVYRKWKGAA